MSRNGRGGNKNKVETTRTFTQPQQLLMVDEATLYTILKEIVCDALKEARAETPKPYTRAEVMKLLNVKATALWNMQQKGILHPIRTCKKLLFDRSEVDALIQGKGTR